MKVTQEEKVIKKIEEYFNRDSAKTLSYELYCIFWADVIEGIK